MWVEEMRFLDLRGGAGPGFPDTCAEASIASERGPQMPAAKPPEFRRRAPDLVARGEPVASVAKNMGISESCLRRWKLGPAVEMTSARPRRPI